MPLPRQLLPILHGDERSNGLIFQALRAHPTGELLKLKHHILGTLRKRHDQLSKLLKGTEWDAQKLLDHLAPKGSLEKALENALNRNKDVRHARSNHRVSRKEVLTKATDLGIKLRVTNKRRSLDAIAEDVQNATSKRRAIRELARTESSDATEILRIRLDYNQKRRGERILHECEKSLQLCVYDKHVATEADRTSLAKALHSKDSIVVAVWLKCRNYIEENENDATAKRKMKDLLDLFLGSRVVGLNLGELYKPHLFPDLLAEHVRDGGPVRAYYIETNRVTRLQRKPLVQALKEAREKDRSVVPPQAAWLQLTTAEWKAAVAVNKCPMGKITKAKNLIQAAREYREKNNLPLV